ncbi:MAG TPA: helix-turn-helix domain-containing protein [Gaiellaceae bacterium]|nr:helix-turn-helix domain-containing protein [Gaiellaceae bacterium]
MLTVPEAARRANRNPETIRRWIRAGKLPARKIGMQHVIEEDALEAVLDDEYEMLPLPPELELMADGRPQPNWVRIIRQSRENH